MVLAYFSLLYLITSKKIPLVVLSSRRPLIFALSYCGCCDPTYDERDWGDCNKGHKHDDNEHDHYGTIDRDSCPSLHH